MKHCFLIFLLTTLAASAGSAQTGGLSYLKLGSGGRAAGMAEAFTAVADDATATYWNPAGILFNPGPSLVLSHNEWIQDVRSEFVSFVAPKDRAGWGLSLNSVRIAGIELRGVQPAVEPISTFSAYNLALGAAYARRITAGLAAGVGIKFLYEKIYIEEAAGFALDAGVLYRPDTSPIRLGMVIKNLGKMSRLGGEASTMPLTLRTGAAFAPPAKILGAHWLLAADLSVSRGGDLHTSWGMEVKPFPLLALRAGYQTGYETRGAQFGLGLRGNRFGLDYGVVPFQQNLGIGHRLSFSFFW